MALLRAARGGTMRTCLRKISIAITIILISAIQLAAQYSQQMSLGRSTLYSVPASNMALREATPLRLATAEYFFEVGGVTFESVARLKPGLIVNDMSLVYDSARPDGQRLLVNFDGAALIAPVFDWQFVPAARFAASPYTACFTLFGDPNELNNPAAAEHVKQNLGRVIKFAPAFKNTLVGLRLMQLDMLIISADAVELPKLNSRYILGTGESAPDIVSNTAAAERIHRGLKAFDSPRGEQGFESYVINDRRFPVYISSSNGYLTLSGVPSYFTFNIQGRETPHPMVRPNEKLNDWLASQTATLREINPDVWDNAVITAQYAALFRYIKQNYPHSWQIFYGQIAGIRLTPTVTTPDVVVDPREKELADLYAVLEQARKQRSQRTPPNQ
jgi:hypothetical protein